ncbi:T9SS type A sorting domain-containing protein [Aquirufa sp. HETE-83D]|uniref:T9SS type A sorting domain-containing protein n=1 Tax=Aquirufa esocilacus TaxID=3096513 RepID=A0ABW6DJV8_9BACT
MNRLLVFALFLPLISTSAQSISPMTVNTGGNLDFSIGESASIKYYQSSNQISLSSGFIQSFTPLVTGIVNRFFEEGEGIVLSPNPATDYVRLKGGLAKAGFVEFHLIDLQGRFLNTYPTNYYINYVDKEINITQLQEGTYFIRLIYSSSDGVKQALSFKFIKIN